jgi:hypothetical protein
MRCHGLDTGYHWLGGGSTEQGQEFYGSITFLLKKCAEKIF